MITVLKNGPAPVIIRQASVTVIKPNTEITVEVESMVLSVRVKPFSFTATAGQTTFTLPSTPRANGIFVVSINGALQNQSAGDYSISGSNVILNAGVDAGDKVFGVYEEE